MWQKYVVYAYTFVSVVGTALFLGFGIHYTKDMSDLHSLSHLITATPAIDTAFAWFMLLHGLLGALTYFVLIANACYSAFFALFIVTMQILTGMFNTQDYSDPHYAYAVLAFASTLLAAVAVLVFRHKSQVITKIKWRLTVAIAFIALSATLLICFGIIVQSSCCNWEGPFEWTAMFLISFIPFILYDETVYKRHLFVRTNVTEHNCVQTI